MEEERRQAHAHAALALLTASMEKDGVCDFPILLAMDLMDELGGGDEEAGALSLVMALTSLAEHLLLRSSQAHGVAPAFELQSMSLQHG
jgi:hypothetical protein